MLKGGRVMGLTGGIASGKSSVAAYFANRQIPVIDADLIARGLLARNEPGWQLLTDEFGSRFLDEDGNLARARLRRVIFKDRKLRVRLDKLIHPLIRLEISRMVSELTFGGSSVLVEVPLLYEAGWQDDFDLIIVVYADRRSCLDRLVERDQLDLQAATAAFAAQGDLEKKSGRADFVIDNSGEWSETVEQLDNLLVKLQSFQSQ